MTQSTFIETENEEPVQGITEIAVCGYKSIYQECQIDVFADNSSRCQQSKSQKNPLIGCKIVLNLK